MSVRYSRKELFITTTQNKHNLPRYVLVYGTLKKGFNNHRVLGNSEFVADTYVKGSLYTNGGFPQYLEEGNDTIKCELYLVKDADTLKALDRLEGEGRMYIRKPVMYITTDHKEGKADIYVWNYSLRGLRQFVPNDAGLCEFLGYAQDVKNLKPIATHIEYYKEELEELGFEAASNYAKFEMQDLDSEDNEIGNVVMCEIVEIDNEIYFNINYDMLDHDFENIGIPQAVLDAYYYARKLLRD